MEVLVGDPKCAEGKRLAPFCVSSHAEAFADVPSPAQ
jgi:hypothetical protein